MALLGHASKMHDKRCFREALQAIHQRCTAFADRLGNKRSLEGLFYLIVSNLKQYPSRLDKYHMLV